MAHILIWSDRPDVFGAEQINHEIALAIVREGHRATFVQGPARHHLVRRREELGIAHEWLEPDDVYDLTSVPRQLADTSEPRAVLARTRPDLIAFSDSCPFSNLTAKQVAIELGIPFVTTIHCVDPAWWHSYRRWRTELNEVLARATEVVAVSQANLDQIAEHLALRDGTGRVIHNGRPAEFFSERDPAARRRIREELGIDDDAVVCVTVARLGTSKGYQYQVEAMQRLRQWDGWPRLHFLWVGHGHLAARLGMLTRLTAGADRVRLLGLRTDVPDLLDASDIFVLPSQYEGMPLSVLEAMAKGLPVVATAVSGTPEALGGTGFLVPDPAAEAIAEPLADQIRLLASDAELRRASGQRAARRARRLFSLDRMQREYLELFDRALRAEHHPIRPR